MRRFLALAVLLTALGVLTKLAWKRSPTDSDDSTATGTGATSSASVSPGDAGVEAALQAKYPAERDLIERTLRDYHHNALEIERTDGLRGLVLLDKLGLEAVFLYEKFPKEFQRLRESLSDEAAADLLVHWREYFALKRADDLDRGILVSEIASLKPAQRQAAAAYPSTLPLILAEPVGMTEIIERWKSEPEQLRDAIALLDFVSLEAGAADLRAALRTLDIHGSLGIEAFRLHGMDGFAIVKLYGPLLEALGDSIPLDDALILTRVNAEDLDGLLDSSSAEQLAVQIRHLASLGLMEALGTSPHALRLAVEFGPLGEEALRQAGPDAADLVYEEFSQESMLMGQAVAALAEHGEMGLAMLAKYSPDEDFREILRRYGPRVIPPIAQSDPVPEALAALRGKEDKSYKEALAASVLAWSGENGQETIRRIRKDGMDRAEELAQGGIAFYQFLPLYDLLHLGRVVTRGYTPTSGELAWAVVDGCFVVVDVLSLAALQPQGAAAAEAARSEVKAIGREVARRGGRELAEEATAPVGRSLARAGSEETAEWLARWWTVRLAGGTYRVLQRLPEALARMDLAAISAMGRPLCQKAGLRLSTWAPVRFASKGAQVIQSIPPERGIKYLAAQAVQASVGVVGIHKMEEHMASRRPQDVPSP